MICANERCKREFKPKKAIQRFCSKKCRNDSNYNRYFTRSAYKANGISTGTVGAISDLRVCVDLLTKGYAVFRALSQSCPCDLAILKDGRLLTIESRTGTENKETGTINWSKAHFKSDHFAVVLPDRIFYDPELP